ncbi:MAG: PTS sugar transporter subunit IIA [Anaerolineaceae bacterium]
MFKIESDLVLLDVNAVDAEDVIRLLCGKLEDLGYISPEHVHAILERERKYPTGLPTSPFCVALPHGEAEGVHESALAFARLQKPVVFRNMADANEALDVKMVFLLVNNDPKNQVKALRRLSEMFAEPGQLIELALLVETNEVVKMLTEILME